MSSRCSTATNRWGVYGTNHNITDTLFRWLAWIMWLEGWNTTHKKNREKSERGETIYWLFGHIAMPFNPLIKKKRKKKKRERNIVYVSPQVGPLMVFYRGPFRLRRKRNHGGRYMVSLAYYDGRSLFSSDLIHWFFFRLGISVTCRTTKRTRYS